MRCLGVAVQSGHCVDVPGHPLTLCRALQYHNFHWMPKYTIYLHDRQFGMEDYVAEVLIHAREADNDNGPYCFLGHGTNKEMAIQQAAHVAMARLRHDLPEMAEGPLKFMPALSSSGEVFYPNNFSPKDSPSTVAMVQAMHSKDREYHAYLYELCEARRALKAVKSLASLYGLHSPDVGHEDLLDGAGVASTSRFRIPSIDREVPDVASLAGQHRGVPVQPCNQGYPRSPDHWGPSHGY